jgi:hypothetical protein
MDARTAWAVVTGGLTVGWAVIVAPTIVFITGWSDNVKMAVAGVIAGAGAALILQRGMQTRP